MRYIFTLFMLLMIHKTHAQLNCEAFKYYGDTLKYKACIKSEEIAGHYQFSKAFQQKLDEVIEIDSTFAYAYKEKSVAYLKSGDFIGWKKLIDKAVKYDPEDNLGYRGWCRYQFFRDYKGAIKDIEKLESIVSYDIGTSVNGDYHLNIAKAICYKALGNKTKAIEIIEKQLQSKDYYVGLFDYFHLGVLYLETNQLKKAKQTLEKQITENDFAETHYYLALVSKELKDKVNYNQQLQIAKKMYLQQNYLFDGYTHHFDKIFLADIENEINKET